MKKRTLSSVAALALLFQTSPLISHAQQAGPGSQSLVSHTKPQRRNVAPLRKVDAPEGRRVVVTSDASLDGYVTYQSGDRFYVVIPQARMMEGGAGQRFEQAEVQQRDEDLVLSFRLEPGSVATVSQKFNKLDITLTPSESARSAVKKEAASASTSTDGGAKQSAFRKALYQPTLFAQGLRPSSFNRAPAHVAGRRLAPARVPQGISFLPSTEKIKETDIDLSVPESPAFTVLGLTPQTVVRPTTPRELATSLINGVDENGNFQNGVALDTVPYLLLFGNNLTLDAYRNSPGTRFFARTQLSIGTTKGSTDADKSARLALGLHLTFFDEGDPRLDRELSQCFTEMLQFPPMPAGISIDEREQFLADAKNKVLANLREAAEKCRKASRKRNWNRSSLVVGLAPSWISESGNVGNMRWNGGGVWTSYAYGFDGVEGLKDVAQLILHARYRNKEKVADPDNEGEFITQDSFYSGLRFRFGGPTFAGSLEGTYRRNKPSGADADDLFRLSFGAERRLSSDLWLQFALGGEGGRRDGQSHLFVLTSFKYALSKDRTFEDRSREQLK